MRTLMHNSTIWLMPMTNTVKNTIKLMPPADNGIRFVTTGPVTDDATTG